MVFDQYAKFHHTSIKYLLSSSFAEIFKIFLIPKAIHFFKDVCIISIIGTRPVTTTVLKTGPLEPLPYQDTNPGRIMIIVGTVTINCLQIKILFSINSVNEY